MNDGKHICPWCYFGRAKKDICGVYCTGGLENPDGTCDRFIDCHNRKEIRKFKAAQAGEGGQNEEGGKNNG